ncbi:hypothetical protein DIPPA_07990 [Diplonema papillatum]|nr:hypothetical protein DIPPA_07990 [Diplonema papillatum]
MHWRLLGEPHQKRQELLTQQLVCLWLIEMQGQLLWLPEQQPTTLPWLEPIWRIERLLRPLLEAMQLLLTLPLSGLVVDLPCHNRTTCEQPAERPSPEVMSRQQPPTPP